MLGDGAGGEHSMGSGPSGHALKSDVVALEEAYKKQFPLWEKVLHEALFIVNDSLNSSEVRIHSVIHRVKTFKSFSDKAERKQLTNPFDQIRDAVGIRIVCLFISEIERIAELVQDAFEVLDQDNKIDGVDVSSFGYMSFHLIVKMKKSYSGPRYRGIGEMPFEIQIRTIAMDAWAAASHYLDYKSEGDVPSDLRRDFYALSGLFYVADRHFEMFFKSKQAAIAEISKTFEQPTQDRVQELNLDSLTAYLQLRFADRVQSDAAAVSELLNELRVAGLKSMNEMQEMVDKNFDWFIEREAAKPPGDPDEDEEDGTVRRFTSIGVVRIILSELYQKGIIAKRPTGQPSKKLRKKGSTQTRDIAYGPILGEPAT
jgi:putative GTP pyrophosphokinase